PAVMVIDSPNKPLIKIEPQLRAEVDLLKEIMRYYVFEHSALLAQQLGQRRVVRELFNILFEAVQPNSKNKGLIPAPFSDSLRDIKRSSQRPRGRLVADLIASMTEQQAVSLYQRLVGLVPGSIRDLIIR